MAIKFLLLFISFSGKVQAMKISRLFIALIFFVWTASAQETNAPASNPNKTAIVVVLKQMQGVIQQSKVLVAPTPAQVNYARLNKLPAPQPKPELNLKKFVELSAGIDTSGCPDDFKSAWNNFILAVNNASKQPKNHALTDFFAVLVNAPAGVVVAAKDIENTKSQKDSTKDALQDALLQLRLVCSSYGVK
jgi:hypothetical protein